MVRMRTIRRVSVKLNKHKMEQVRALVEAFCAEKDYWMRYLQQPGNISKLQDFYKTRNALVASEYVSAQGLPANHWKNALEVAIKQMKMYWQAIYAGLKPLIKKNGHLTAKQQQWCRTVLKNYEGLQLVMQGGCPELKCLPDAGAARRAARYLHRIIRRHVKNLPRVKMQRSMVLTKITYKLEEKNGKQFLSIASMTKRRRLIVPLLGSTRLSGNISLVIQGDHIEAHYTADLKQRGVVKGKDIALDAGYTEAFTDQHGNAYGQGLGTLLSEKSDAIRVKGARRGKLRALREKAIQKGQTGKAARIQKFNLGKIKWDRVQDKARVSIKNIINRGLNEVLEQRPETIVSENLSGVFSYSKGGGFQRKLNRRLSSWTRGVLQEKVAFKALAGCSRHEQVNPAYSSQTCPNCGYVSSDNRKAHSDTFQCTHCGHADHADRVAAMNLLSRKGDKEITLYVPYRSVKTILEQRFHRRLESEKSSGTVPGRTLDMGHGTHPKGSHK